MVVSATHLTSLPLGNIPSTHFCQRLRKLQSHSAAGRITVVITGVYKIKKKSFGEEILFIKKIKYKIVRT